MVKKSVVTAIALLMGIAPMFPASAAEGSADASTVNAQEKKFKVVLQVSDADPIKWGLALNNARNVQNDVGKEEADIEIVVYGPGIGMLKKGSEAAARIQSARESGVKIVACENTMHTLKLTYDDMLPTIGYVPAGVTELVKKQQQGYAYIRP